MKGSRLDEEKWHRYRKPERMLDYLRVSGASPRKLRLFACACFRNVGSTLNPADAGMAAVLAAEQFADGRIDLEQLRTAYQAAQGRWGCQAAEDNPAWAASQSANSAIYHAGERAKNAASRSGTGPATSVEAWLRCSPAAGQAEKREQWIQTKLLRDDFHPFGLVSIDPAWLGWNGGAVVSLAQQIYDERAFECLPNLAQVLEEAGCCNADLIAHCRKDGPHVCGCWPLDLLLGKV